MIRAFDTVGYVRLQGSTAKAESKAENSRRARLRRQTQGRRSEKAVALAEDRCRVVGVEAAARKGEFVTRPIDGGIVALEPVEAEDDGIRDGNEAKSDDLGVVFDVKGCDDFVRDEARRDRAVINSTDGNGIIL